jgi:hypothetical protein
MGPWQLTESRSRSVRGWSGGLPLRDTASRTRIASGSKRLQKPETAGVTVRPLDSLRDHAAYLATAMRETLQVARLEALSTNYQS